MFCKKGILRNFAKFTGKHLCRSLFLIKLEASTCNLIKKETLAQVFFVNFAKFLRTLFLQNTSGRLLLKNGAFAVIIDKISSLFYFYFVYLVLTWSISLLAKYLCLILEKYLKILYIRAVSKFPHYEEMRLVSTCRSRRFQMFYKIVVFKNFTRFARKHLCRSLLFNKLKRLEWLQPLLPTLILHRFLSN